MSILGDNIHPGLRLTVPIDHEAFEAFQPYIDHLRRNEIGKADFSRHVEAGQSGTVVRPLYFCINRDRFEDGTHRWAVAKERGDKTIEVICGNGCDKVFSSRGPLWRKHAPNQRDFEWVKACDNQKWPYIEHGLALTGAQVVDIGTQMGFSAVRAEQFGAELVWGLELRKEAFDAAYEVAYALGTKAVDFIECDAREQIRKPGFITPEHTVFCMGLLHYWPEATIKGVLSVILGVDQVAIECRTTTGSQWVDCGGQTIMPEEWLLDAIRAAGLVITSHWTHGKPEIQHNRTMLTARKGGPL